MINGPMRWALMLCNQSPGGDAHPSKAYIVQQSPTIMGTPLTSEILKQLKVVDVAGRDLKPR